MATPESYRPEESGSSPAPPELPARGQERFQFSLKNLLWFMFASSLLAVAIHYAVKFLPPPPGQATASIPALWSLGIGALLYLFIRVPFLLVGGMRATGRWQAIQTHRRKLAAWADEKKKAHPRSTDARESPVHDEENRV